MMRPTLNAHTVKRCTFVAFSRYPVNERFFLHEFFIPYYAWSCHQITHRIKDQGHHNDRFHPTPVNSLSSNTPILNPKNISQSVIVTGTVSAFVDTTSDSDLYHHRITSNVSSGASWHACTEQRHSPCDSHICDCLSTSVPNWVPVSNSLALNVPQLHILNNKYPTLLVISIIVVQGRSSKNNKVYFVKLPFCVINTSYQSRKLKMKSLFLMEAIPKLHPSSLLTDSLGGACLYLIYMLKTKQTPIWVCHVLGLIISCHSFGCHVPMHYL